MKKQFGAFIIILILFSSCSESNPLDFVIGSWERQNSHTDRKTFEFWEKVNKSTYKGLGITLKNNDTIFKEELRIIKINGKWNYEVIGVNPEPTYFEFTSLTDSSFICENSKNDFPKKIEYTITKNKLIATISDGSSSIQFNFIKID